MDPADQQLVRDAQGGVRSAFAALVDRYRGRIFALSVAIMGDHASALELTRETFVRAHRDLPRLDDPKRFPGWLARIAYQAGRDARHRRLEDSETELANDRSENVHAGTLAMEPLGRGDAERALLEALLLALPERVRVALDLRYREGLSYQEIAETLDVSRSDVVALLNRGARKLRGKLRPYLRKRAGS